MVSIKIMSDKQQFLVCLSGFVLFMDHIGQIRTNVFNHENESAKHVCDTFGVFCCDSIKR